MILSYLRTAFLYLVLILSIRMMGKRQIGQMEASEFVVTMLVANLASIPMQDAAIPLYSGLVPILTVLGMELVLSGLIMYSVALRRFICGKPVILIDNGKIVQKNLRRTRVTLGELISQLREKDVLDLESVQYAILENNGTLSVFPYPKEKNKQQSIPIIIIDDGYFSKADLQKAGKDEAWLDSVLKQHGADRHSTLLLSVDEKDHVVFLEKEYG